MVLTLVFDVVIENNVFRPSPDTIALGDSTACCTPFYPQVCRVESLFSYQQYTASGGGDPPRHVEVDSMEHRFYYS